MGEANCGLFCAWWFRLPREPVEVLIFTLASLMSPKKNRLQLDTRLTRVTVRASVWQLSHREKLGRSSFQETEILPYKFVDLQKWTYVIYRTGFSRLGVNTTPPELFIRNTVMSVMLGRHPLPLGLISHDSNYLLSCKCQSHAFFHMERRKGLADRNTAMTVLTSESN